MSYTSFSRLLTIPLTLAFLLTPLIFVPFTPNYYLTPQLTFLTALTLTLGLLLASYVLSHREFPFSPSPLTLPLTLFALTTTTTLLTNAEARTESFFSLGLLFYELSLLAYFATLLPTTFLKKTLPTLFFLTTSLLALHSILQLTILHTISALPAFMQTQTFTPTGSPYTTISLLAIALVSSLGSLRSSRSYHRLIRILAATLSLISLIGHTSLALSNSLLPPLLPWRASWSLALDSLKDTHNLFFGTGFANFGLHFNAYRPLYLNATNWWNLTPTTASNELFQLLIVGGLPLLLSLVFLLFKGFAHASKDADPTLLYLLGATTAALCLVPGSIPLYTTLFLTLGLLAATPATRYQVTAPSHLLLSVLLLLVFGSGAYYFSHYLRAELSMFRAASALKQNDSATVYTHTLAASRLLPHMTHYRLSNAQVNLSLGAAHSQKNELSDEEKETISRLVSQSITEAKIATSLRPRDSRTWANLGNTYANLLTVAEKADQFALSAYAQAVALDPGSAPLRAEFGALLTTLAQKATDEKDQASYLSRAGAELQTALQLRPDFAQAAYNLAKVRSLIGDKATAIQILENIIKNLEPDSSVSQLVQKDLDTLRSQSATPSGQANSEVLN